MAVISTSKKKKQKENKQNLSQFDLIFYRSSIIDGLAKSLEKKLKQAGLSDDPRMYVSRIFLFLLVGIIVGAMLVVLGILMFRDYEITRLTKFAVK